MWLRPSVRPSLISREKRGLKFFIRVDSVFINQSKKPPNHHNFFSQKKQLCMYKQFVNVATRLEGTLCIAGKKIVLVYRPGQAILQFLLFELLSNSLGLWIYDVFWQKLWISEVLFAKNSFSLWTLQILKNRIAEMHFGIR